jgi:hypothetical protein
MMFGPQTGGSTLHALRCNEASPSTVELGQSLKGSQRAKRVRSTPTIGRNVATQRFSALGPNGLLRCTPAPCNQLGNSLGGFEMQAH